MRALHKLLSLINEAPVKQAHGKVLKKEPTESPEAGPAKPQKLSTTEKANSFQLSVIFPRDPPSIKPLQLINTDNLDECILISV